MFDVPRIDLTMPPLPDIAEGDLVVVCAYGQERLYLVTRRRVEDGGGLTLEVLADPED